MDIKLPREYLDSVLVQLGQAEYLKYLSSFEEKPSRWARRILGKVNPSWLDRRFAKIPDDLKVGQTLLGKLEHITAKNDSMLPIDTFIDNLHKVKSFLYLRCL